jgi:ATP-dependent Lon protease
MIYSEFITTTSNYLKSVRILKDYVTFDMTFPSSWLLPKKGPVEIEILQNSDKDGSIITSFVCQNKTKLIDVIENTIQNVIKTNIEREEKERLFKNKVHELKQIFEKENLENLKGLKFDLEEFANLLTQSDDEVNTEVGEGDSTTK